ncbi:MAG TPA: hypothetical protein VGR89_13630, partial [Puia sp.]|nr:hypothetical protein [Puia sp.]
MSTTRRMSSTRIMSTTCTMSTTRITSTTRIMNLNAILLSLSLTLFLAACHAASQAPAPDFLAQDIDSAVSPGTDFFEYANSGWIKRTPIPASESGWGVGNMVEEDIYQRLRKISEKAAKN